MDKEQQRKEQLTIRKKLSDQKVSEKSKKIAEKLFNNSVFQEAETILIYINFKNEVKTKKIIKQMLKENKRVIVPITDQAEKRLYLSELKDFNQELSSGAYGILEPKEEYRRFVAPQELDLIILPGVAFDQQGNRIGYGGGYYDRLLTAVPHVKTIALAFTEQIIDKVKTSVYDQKVEQIITDKRVVDCKES
ncbi:MAG: 5-formyltetrahydrofolate cyclo-ligase, partial [Bacillota bacterium]